MQVAVEEGLMQVAAEEGLSRRQWAAGEGLMYVSPTATYINPFHTATNINPSPIATDQVGRWVWRGTPGILPPPLPGVAG